MEKKISKLNLFKKYSPFLLLFIFAVLNFFIWNIVLAHEKDFLTVAFLDVGQGDAIFIEAPNGNQLLIDGGSNKKVLRELGKIMPFYDRSIDMVLATHPDKDHIGGLVPVIKNFKIDYILESGAVGESSVFKEFVEVVKKEQSQNIFVKRGNKFFLDKDIYLEILFPDREVTDWNPNDASVITKLVYGEKSFLLTGDSPQKMEKYLISLGTENLKSSILKLGHHGSKTSTIESFLGFVDPEKVIISAGLDNKYGHPHQEVIDLVNKFNVPFLETYREGTIIFQTDGENLYLK